MKRCIYHYPLPFNYTKPNGSAVRPIYMLEAFKDCGYIVDAITGYGEERKKKIREIKERILNGVKYDFVYSESLTQPTLLSEKNHFPKYPNLDFGFLKFCRHYDIPVGLFYRDMHWKFKQFKEIVPWYKRLILVPFYRYDLYKYKRCVDILYCANKKIANYGVKHENLKELPPGCKKNDEIIYKKMIKEKTNSVLNVFYVGGIAGIYDISTFLEGMRNNGKVYLTVCTPEEHWVNNKERLSNLLNNRVNVIHEKSDGLAEYYLKADTALFCKKEDPYTDLASPIKAKETLGYGTPIIVSDNLHIAKEVVEGDYGWVVKAESQDISELLDYLCKNPDEISKKTKNAIKAAENNTWKKRAEQVINDMKEIKITN